MRAPKGDERALWRDAMRGVKRLRVVDAPDAPVPPAPPPPAVSSPVDPVPPPVPQKIGTGLDRRSAQRLRRGQMPIEARLDLHGMTQAEAHDALARFLARSQTAGLRAVLVITGKSGVLYGAVPRWLEEGGNHSRILASTRAQAQHGGAGALYLLLRRRR